MDRGTYRRDERRDDRRRRDDDRDHNPRYERDRSRSPPRFDRRDDRRRDRSPPRDAHSRGGNHQPYPPRDNDHHRGRDPPPGAAPSRRNQERGAPGDVKDAKSTGGYGRGGLDSKSQRAAEARMAQQEGEDDEAYMARIMGFNSFRTTQNTQIPGNDQNYAVYKVKKSEYRQYMNRQGGFNRPLSPSRN